MIQTIANRYSFLANRWPESTWRLLSYAALAAVFLADFFTPRGFVFGALYIFVVLLASLTRNIRFVILVTAVAIVLSIVGAFLSPPLRSGLEPVMTAFNRFMSIASIALTALLAAYAIALQAIERERVSANRDLARGNELFRIASESGRVGGWTVSLPDYQLVWSDEVARIHGMPPGYSPSLDEGIGFYAPEHIDRISTMFAECVQSGAPFDSEFQIVTAGGNRLWVRCIGRAIRNAEGKIIEVQGALQDIDARKCADEVLMQSVQRFQQLAESMPMVVWTADADGKLDYVTNSLANFTGISQADLLEDKWIQVVHAEDQLRWTQAWREALEAGKPFAFEGRVRRKDGVYRLYLARAVPLFDADGAITKWYGSSMDTHDFREAEAESARLHKRVTATLEGMTDAFFSLGRDWRFIYLNQVAERLLHRHRADLIGRIIWEEFPEAVGSTFYKEYHRALQQDVAVHFEEYFTPLKTWFAVSAYPSDEGLAVYFRNITHERNLAEQLRKAQRLEAVGQLTGGLAHDFNNLLTVILGNAELLKEQLKNDARLAAQVGMMMDAAQRGAELTRCLLAFARQQALEPRAVDVNQLLVGMDALLRRTLGEHIEIEFIQFAELWPALIDPAQLDSALLNLCLNSRDAMPGGGHLTVETANVQLDENYAEKQVDVRAGQYVLVSVSDTGSGIAREHLGRIFEPFFTTKEKNKGTGLGLAMVYGFVKQSGGHVNIYSEPGQGTTIKLYLPRAFDVAENAQSDIGRGAVVGGTETILLVEDDPMVRQFVLGQLVALGYTVIEAENAKQALDLIRQGADMDLLFTDVVMPGMSGRQLADEAVKVRPELKVLYTSGYTENAIVHHGRLDPGVLLLSKPYRRAELASKLRAALGAKR